MSATTSRFTFPCITMEQLLAFDSNRPETWTPSPLVNAIMDALPHIRPVNGKTLGQFLGLDAREVLCGLHAMTGLSLPELLEAWRVHRFHRLRKEEPELSGKEMANRLAFCSQGALWNFLTTKGLINPLTRQGWTYGDYYFLRQTVKHAAIGKAKAEIKDELRRRKWKELTKNNNE